MHNFQFVMCVYAIRFIVFPIYFVIYDNVMSFILGYVIGVITLYTYNQYDCYAE